MLVKAKRWIAAIFGRVPMGATEALGLVVTAGAAVLADWLFRPTPDDPLPIWGLWVIVLVGGVALVIRGAVGFFAWAMPGPYRFLWSRVRHPRRSLGEGLVSLGGRIAGRPGTVVVPTSVEHRLIDVTLEYLTGLFAGRLQIEGQVLAAPFLGEWIRVRGSLDDVSSDEPGTTEVWFDSLQDPTVYLSFDKAPWERRLAQLRKGMRLVVDGQIESISAGSVSLVHCELRSADVVPEKEPGSIPSPEATDVSSASGMTSLPFITEQLPDGVTVYDVSADYLIGLTANLTSIQAKSRVQPWLGRTARFRGQVYDVREHGDGRVVLSLQADNGFVFAWFSGPDQIERVRVMDQKDQVRVMGRIYAIDGSVTLTDPVLVEQ